MSLGPENSCLDAGLSRAWYGAPLTEFLNTQSASILGELATKGDFVLVPEQKDAWLAQVAFLQANLSGIHGSLFLEFNIPRMGRRIDAVLVSSGVVFVIEFKVGERTFDRSALDQVWDYALDLKNFHEGSHGLPILPILVATRATESPSVVLHADEDKVYRPVPLHPDGFRPALDLGLQTIPASLINEEEWARSPYRPTPTIVEAARALYAQHSVEAIARCDAQDLSKTSRRIEELVDEANADRRKLICFVTGVPGAGKTLVGLNIATRRRGEKEPTHAVFLSGNGPLVAVLREALTRDEYVRRRVEGEKVRKDRIGESVKAFIQNVHHFRDEALFDRSHPPDEHVAIFDEAQRAWNLRKTASFMQRRKKVGGFSQSEPEFLVSCMDRHPDWAVVVCLVGGGQEIHDGEAGIEAWLQAVNSKFPHWQMYISSRLTDSEYAAGKALDAVCGRTNAHLDDSLHLAVSMRSFRAENVSAFVKALLDREEQKARAELASLANRYPIVVTRNLDSARRWIRSRARGTERFGLVASSRAKRLKPHAIDIRVDVDPVQWFLNDRDDTRSSYYLEDAATEFQVQGLELDWTCVTWDADLRSSSLGWSYHDFRGSRWQNINNEFNRGYLKNAYRVLLTRARQGMVIFVPPGHSADPTRNPAYYDSTFQYLIGLGLPVLNSP